MITLLVSGLQDANQLDMLAPHHRDQIEKDTHILICGIAAPSDEQFLCLMLLRGVISWDCRAIFR